MISRELSRVSSDYHISKWGTFFYILNNADRESNPWVYNSFITLNTYVVQLGKKTNLINYYNTIIGIEHICVPKP